MLVVLKMVPRTVNMAAAVKAAFTAAQEKALGNVIFNGYIDVVANTINKKAWQYKETNTAPVNLPALSIYRPYLKGWTTNYMEYYTQLGPVPGYDTTSGDPTNFEYVVHSFTPATGNITGLTGLQAGELYTPGLYTNVATIGGRGTGATLDITVDTNGYVTVVTLNSPGSGYAVGDGLTAAPGTIGTGVNFAVFVSTIIVINPAGQPQWAQVPRRFWQNQVGPFVPPNANQEAIQYSFMYPVADSPVPPPIDAL